MLRNLAIENYESDVCPSGNVNAIKQIRFHYALYREDDEPSA